MQVFIHRYAFNMINSVEDETFYNRYLSLMLRHGL